MTPVQLPASSEGIRFSGLAPEAYAAFIDGISAHSKANLHMIIVPGPQQMERMGETLSHQLQIQNSTHLPPLLFLPPTAEDPDNPNLYLDIQYDRITTLSQLLEYRDQSKEKRVFVITTPSGFFSPVPPSDELKAKSIDIERGQELSFDQLSQDLSGHLDYDHEIICEEPGQFAIRGGLIDVYPVNEEAPLRIDFFGDEVESIRHFDPVTQTSRQSLKHCTIQARGSLGGTLRERHIFEYLPPITQWILIDVSKQESQHPNLFNVFERNQTLKTSFKDLFENRKDKADQFLSIAEIEDENRLFEGHPLYELQSSGLQHYRIPDTLEVLGLDRIEKDEQSRTAFLQQCKSWQDQGDRLICTIQEESDQAAIKKMIRKSSRLKGLRFEYLKSDLKTGYRIEQHADIPNWPEINSQSLTCITRHDIFGLYKQRPGKLQRRIIPLKKHVDQLLDFSELVEGDYLVHLSHGICIYRGLQKMEIKGRQEDVIALEFDDHITLYLTLQDSHLLSRYVGIHKLSPKLGRIGGSQWEKTRRAAEEATLDYAANMLKLQATRESHKGIAFSPDNEWVKAFEEAFPFVETPDQLKAIQATKKDMESPQPMDRLICGDVGFGKTEVAMRAAFKAVMDGKQVAVLVPTTVLAQQHYSSFIERMRAYPVMIEMLSRFRSPKQQRDILNALREGKIDIVIGTHRLISNDVHFSDLGLLIIDEEHRFGVKHKEKLKSLREHVDVLSMSATPIPRTLYMALMGARHLSVIETAPSNRLPIKTVVKPYSPDLVSRSIEFELNRGGQVFYLHNRVQTIAEVAKGLESLLPNARIAVGHGQMSEQQLEKIMTRFVAGDYDILVCTTIIESGLDIPNCNTIIIESADRMGLSQLYQLRGRVGRFNRQAYAYLLLHRHGHMIDQARKRLSTMRQYNQLGAGFKIAMRDLELRGSGNLLGMQQSGHIAGVGFDLYCQLLRQSIARLKGEKGASYIRCTIDLDFIQTQGRKTMATTGFQVLKEDSLEAYRVEPIKAHIPSHYIAETQLRIDLYRQLSMLNSIEALETLKSVIDDRFGHPPEELESLFLVTQIRILAEQAQIASVETEGNRLKCRIASGKRDDYLKVGKRFPRLTRHTATLRLHEIITFLKRQIPLHYE